MITEWPSFSTAWRSTWCRWTQVEPLREGVRTFLLASQLTLVDMKQADATFARARDMAAALPEPSATLLNYVNDRNVEKLGPALVPYLVRLGADSPAASPERAAVAAERARLSAARR